MPFCPKCGKLVEEDSIYCTNCGATISIQPQSTQSSTSIPYRGASYPPQRDSTKILITLGYVFSAISLFIMPEIFGTIAVVLGVNIRKRGRGNTILILGSICLLLGLFVTAAFSLFDLFV